jgi:hypothetical protein
VAVWILVVPRPSMAPEMQFLALAALSILSLMPVYHRFYDTRLLLLTLPAVIAVFQRRRFLGAIIAVLTVLAVISVQYRVQVLLVQHAEWQSIFQHKFLFILLLRQQNLELLILFGLYMIAILGIRSSNVREMQSSVYQPAGRLHH